MFLVNFIKEENKYDNLFRSYITKELLLNYSL